MTDETDIPWADVEQGLVWVDSYYDWPLSGISVVEGKKLWFQCVGEDDRGDRRFALYSPPAVWWHRVEGRRRAFERWVGDHWSYTNGVRNPVTLSPTLDWDHYYNTWGQVTRPPLKDEWTVGFAKSHYLRYEESDDDPE